MRSLLTIVLILFATTASAADLLRYDLASVSGETVTGHIEFDLETFESSSNQLISNTEITSLYINFAGRVAETANVDTGGGIFFDNTGATPRMTDALGLLTNGPSIIIRGSSAPFQLDLELVEFVGGDPVILFSTVTTTPPSAVPLPAAAWMLLAGLGGLFGVRRLRV